MKTKTAMKDSEVFQRRIIIWKNFYTHAGVNAFYE
jgi:hypothetical protein